MTRALHELPAPTLIELYRRREVSPVEVARSVLGHVERWEHHLDALRDKLNSQIAFVETGQIKGVWPGYSGGLVKVEVMARFALNRAAEEFYGVARRVMSEANMRLDFCLCDA